MSDYEIKYYDFHCTGLAYINRLRLVKPDGGSPYLSVTLAFLRGKADAEGKVAKTWVDCRIVGGQAKARANTLLEHITEEGADPDKAKIMATVKIGDLKPDPFIYRSGPKAGQPGFSLKGRLLQINHVWLDGSPFDFGDEPEGQSDEALEGELIRSDSDKPMSGAEQSRPAMVKLSKDDPDFLRKKTDLKKQGYRWDPKQAAWCLPQTLAA